MIDREFNAIKYIAILLNNPSKEKLFSNEPGKGSVDL